MPQELFSPSVIRGVSRWIKLDVSAYHTVFVDTPLWKTKHPRKRFQNFRQSRVLLTDRIEIHQLQPLVRPGCEARLMGILETFPRVFCFPKSRINENGGNDQYVRFDLLKINCNL